jgi:type I restriction enzyme S subunit
MMRYDTYKPSGTGWIGEIPKHWEIKRIKDAFIQISKTGNEIGVNNYIPLENIESQTGKLIQRVTNENNEVTNLFKSGDILVNKLRPYLAKVCLPEFDGGVSGEVIVFRVNRLNQKNISSKYYFYRFLSSQFIAKINSITDGVKMPRTNPTKINCLDIAIPPPEEQTAIAQYLDAKTQAIDKKINLLTKKAETYKELRKSIINDVVCKGLDKNVKLKESGIDWIGKIPEHWKISRIKDSFNLFTGNSISDKALFERKENSIDYVSTKDIDVDTGRITYDNGVYIPKKDKSFKIAKANSILICIEGANAGKKIGFTNKDICFVNKLCAIKSRTKNNSDKYFYYFTQSPLFEKQFFAILNGLIGGVSLNSIKYFDIISPTKEEQTSIANYLDEKTQKIDAIVSNIGKQIDTLKELRKTLINDVVTGKIMVNG